MAKKVTKAGRPAARGGTGGAKGAGKGAGKGKSKGKVNKGGGDLGDGVGIDPSLLGPPPLAQVAPANHKKAKPEASLAFALEVAKLAKADKCQNVVLLDVKGLSPVTDYLVLATGTSGRQMQSTADEIITMGKENDFRPLSSSGRESETWICVDFVDVLLHLFNEESRQYYDLEGLWGDAKRVEVG